MDQLGSEPCTGNCKLCKDRDTAQEVKGNSKRVNIQGPQPGWSSSNDTYSHSIENSPAIGCMDLAERRPCHDKDKRKWDSRLIIHEGSFLAEAYRMRAT
eukprot:793918-Pelagomonas_calceolata.AAC.1